MQLWKSSLYIHGMSKFNSVRIQCFQILNNGQIERQNYVEQQRYFMASINRTTTGNKYSRTGASRVFDIYFSRVFEKPNFHNVDTELPDHHNSILKLFFWRSDERRSDGHQILPLSMLHYYYFLHKFAIELMKISWKSHGPRDRYRIPSTRSVELRSSQLTVDSWQLTFSFQSQTLSASLKRWPLGHLQVKTRGPQLT